MGVYDRQIATAKRLIAKFGEPCMWASSVPSYTDDAKPWNEAPSEPTQFDGITIAFFPLDRQYSELVRYLKGTEVQMGGLYGIMPPVDFTPQLTDLCTRKDGTKLRPISIDVLAPNGEIILYTIEFRT